MKLDKAQTKQAITLAALIAVLVGYCVYSMTGKKASTPPSAQTNTTKSVRTSQSAGGVVITPGQIPGASAVNLAVAKRDPFAPRIVPEPASGGPPPAPPAKPLPRLATSHAPLPIFSGGGALAFTAEPRLPASEPEPEPMLVLTGIIKGDTNVAIIRTGSSDRHIVREGQMINGTYRVKTINRDGVVLTRGNRSIYLKLGGRTNVS